MDIERKKGLLQIVIDKISNDVKIMVESIEGEHKAMKEAPSSRKTWSDTIRSQKEDLLIGKSRLLIGLNKVLSATQNLKESAVQTEVVQLGAVVETQDEGGKKEIYLMAFCGGERIEFESNEIILISYGSLLANALKGCRKNDRIRVQLPARTRILTILDVS